MCKVTEKITEVKVFERLGTLTYLEDGNIHSMQLDKLVAWMDQKGHNGHAFVRMGPMQQAIFVGLYSDYLMAAYYHEAQERRMRDAFDQRRYEEAEEILYTDLPADSRTEEFFDDACYSLIYED